MAELKPCTQWIITSIRTKNALFEFSLTDFEREGSHSAAIHSSAGSYHNVGVFVDVFDTLLQTVETACTNSAK